MLVLFFLYYYIIIKKKEDGNMKEILKTLSKYKWSILLVIGLLIGQAYCDLALPTYTSNIVNVGIQQGGIENITPKAMREETYNGSKYYLAG